MIDTVNITFDITKSKQGTKGRVLLMFLTVNKCYAKDVEYVTSESDSRLIALCNDDVNGEQSVYAC